jgi:hypothetical protein
MPTDLRTNPVVAYRILLSREEKIDALDLTLTSVTEVTLAIHEEDLPLYIEQGGYFPDAGFTVDDVLEETDIHQALVLERYEVYATGDDLITTMYHRDYPPDRKVEADNDVARLKRLVRDPLRVHLVLVFS